MSLPPQVEIHSNPPHPLAPWFDHHRGNRQRERDRVAATDREKPSRAVFTMVRDEAFFLPIWLGYYSRFFAAEDIYVLDHQSQDGSTDHLDCNVSRLSQPVFDESWHLETVQKQQHELLERYDHVIFSDVDELVVPHPSLGDLGWYLDHFDEPFVNCIGYEILHLPELESPLDTSRPIFDQREHWFSTALYNKVGIAAEPIEWVAGFHRRADYHFNPDPDLFMIHLHRVDFDECLRRHLSHREFQWSKSAEDEGWALHNLIVDESAFREWFFGDSMVPNYPIQLERIGAEWKGVV